MGPSHAREQKAAQDDPVKALLREKDDRIVTLETRLEAYTARASTAQTRLLKTIDVLDALRSQHALDIAVEERAKSKLVREVDRWRSMARNLEVDRDELKDVVEDLIEKVACTSRNTQVCRLLYSPYPSNAFQRGDLNPAFPEQVVVATIDDGRTKHDHDNDLLAYATAIIARLRMELDFERQSHGKTAEEANLRIEELEAKVAVREAELENCIIAVGDPSRNVAVPALEEPNVGKKLPEPKLLSDEACLRFLESNKARNRSLEIEIRHIAERLEQARRASSTCSEKPAPQNGHKAIPTPSPCARSASVDPNAMSRSSDAGNTASTPAQASPSTALSIAQLDNQIRTMTTHVDALVSERTTLIEAAAKQRRVTEGISIDTFQDVLRVEGECVRLQAEVDDLREQLQQARTFARGREKALLREIADLRASTSNSTAPHSAHACPSLLEPVDDALAIEEAMELASPLTPTVVLDPFPVHPPHNVGAETGAETDLVSFPFSPTYVTSPAPDVPPTPLRTARGSPGSQDIETVREGLDVARTHLARKEEALVQLRAEMERLQLEVHAQKQDHTNEDGDGDGGGGG